MGVGRIEGHSFIHTYGGELQVFLDEGLELVEGLQHRVGVAAVAEVAHTDGPRHKHNVAHRTHR